MSLTYCEGCQQLEGDVIVVDDGYGEETCCVDCMEPVTRVPEHDDMDLER
jgi:hypothetical protein